MWGQRRRPIRSLNIIRIWTATFCAVVVFISPNSAHLDRERRKAHAI